jgi:hypothetical protein
MIVPNAIEGKIGVSEGKSDIFIPGGLPLLSDQ